ncbi:uncharacterized protein LOC128335636 isoform X2 [Hemicordylus capensis]|uniref:uncharacterized protein LOC128335636 isoform X2 n=1 Tax=Hemicordylus capensis TaxID=884348 RepID=UPI0023035C20|nr:uncharacterized protein LOC128335636 isoform X2 [Hemicordylus capensis]
MEPSCTHVPDFGTCQGNALNFCPKGVTCGCKDQAPFCKCPSYRNDWEDYWYMGPKCEQLWSTLDLIVVAAVPAVTLSVVAAVIMQWVNYCKRTPKDGARTHSQPRPQAQEIPRYAHNLDDGSRYIFPHRSEEDNRTVQNPKFPPIPLKEQPHEHPPLRRVKGSSYVPHPPLRRAMPEDANRPPYVKQPRYWEHETTNVDYEEENPFSVMGMRQFPKPGASPFLPPSDYDEDLPPVNYPNAGRPYRMAHPQNIYY